MHDSNDLEDQLIRLAAARLIDPCSDEHVVHPTDESLACYVCGDLSDAEGAAMVEHLVHCRLCRDIVASSAPILNVDPLVCQEDGHGVQRLAHPRAGNADAPLDASVVRPTSQALYAGLLERVRAAGEVIFRAVVSIGDSCVHIVDTDAEVVVDLHVATRRSDRHTERSVVFVRQFRGRKVEMILGANPGQRFHLQLTITPFDTDCGNVTLYRGLRQVAVAPVRSGSVVFRSVKPAHYSVAIEESGFTLGSLDLDLRKGNPGHDASS